MRLVLLQRGGIGMNKDFDTTNSLEPVVISRAHMKLGESMTTGVTRTDGNVHWRRKGQRRSLCGKVAKRSLNEEDFATCEKCQVKYGELLQEQYKTEIRNYWDKPNGSLPVGKVIVPTKKKQVYERVPLPDEYLPTGSGRRVRL
jgi:hypothetical protein